MISNKSRFPKNTFMQNGCKVFKNKNTQNKCYVIWECSRLSCETLILTKQILER